MKLDPWLALALATAYAPAAPAADPHPVVSYSKKAKFEDVREALGPRIHSANSSGVLPTTSKPCLPSRSRTSEVRIALTVSPLSRSTISRGVAAGANQWHRFTRFAHAHRL